MVTATTTQTRQRVRITGTVQGVGFRPHVFRIANEMQLTGWVRNDGSGVSLEIQGENVKNFIDRLQQEKPPLAKIINIHHQEIELQTNEAEFKIIETQTGAAKTNIPPDYSICETCLSELFDPQSRFYRYPFINCTHCGPRYTITETLPYDRPQTSMASFKMCHDCENEYLNPTNRRYHAQPIGCDQCGPQLSSDLETIASYIKQGKIVALKSLGGYQLICDAFNKNTVTRLRKTKERNAKPFALMVANIASAKQFVYCDHTAEKLLNSHKRPIVILPKKTDELANTIAPGLSNYGVMLPYTPIHYLLFNYLLGCPVQCDWLQQTWPIALIVTSANPGSCPLIKDDNEARTKLKPIADLIVSYNREILIRVDDSVMSINNNKHCFIRRARSFVPEPIQLSHEIPNTLALGGYLKNTICIIRGNEAFVSQHIGDLNNSETIRFYHEIIEHLLKILAIKPKCIAHDLHPQFYSSQFAAKFNLPIFKIQHHHAHLAAIAAEHHLNNSCLGVALDGFGLGDDGGIWGGELFLYDTLNYQRLGHLKNITQPGGDAAVKQPWRMAASVLHHMGLQAEISKKFANIKFAEQIPEMINKQINSPFTSSCGRLFAAASALLGVCLEESYEGQAAMQLESLVTRPSTLTKGWEINNNQLNLLSTLKYLLTCDPQTGSNIFHGTLIAALTEWVTNNAKNLKLHKVLLGGGCFLNKVLTENLVNQLSRSGLTPYLAECCPPNDGGISLGQAWVAGNKMME